MPHLTRFRVQGYRAISEPIELTGLGPYVALYGDNAVGKSSVLEAVGLLGRLCQFVNNELAGTGAPWQFDVFYNRFGQDEWMFHAGGSTILLEGVWSDGVEVTVRLERQVTGIAIGVARVFAEGQDLLAARGDARSAAHARRMMKFSNDFYEEAEDGVLLSLEREWTNREEGLFQTVVSRASIQAFTSPVIPVSDQIRNDFLSAWISKDVSRRKRARAVAATFGELFPALGPGQLEPAENTNKAKDVAWVNEAGLVPLDHLGGGVQSVFATLARLATTDARIACIDEPEAFVGERALRPLVAVFRGAPARGLADQIWIATHAVTLADDESPLFLLEREGGIVRATPTSRADLVQLTPSVGPDPKPLSLGRLSLDGSVRLPESLRDRLGLKVGDFVHYVDIDDGGARIVSPAELERVLGSDE